MSKIGRGLPEIANRGYQVLFRPNESNRCPGCGHAQWYVGRVTAECFFCGTALPLADAKWAGGDGLSHRFPDLRVAIEAAGASERRQDERRPSRGKMIRLLVDGSARAVAVHNISSGGAMVDRLAKLVAGATIELIADGGEIVPAEVRWTDNGKVGLQFARPLPLDAFVPTAAE